MDVVGFAARRAVVLALILTSAGATAGGSPENAMLVIDPGDPTSMYVGNFYKNARGIPDSNILYMNSQASSYETFTQTNQAAFLGTLQQRSVADHIDYVVIAPFSGFYVSYSGGATSAGSAATTCSTPQRYSISAVYTLARLSANFMANNNPQTANQFFGDNSSATVLGFSASQGYLGGAPNSSSAAQSYYLGALLGFTNGSLGNSVADLLNMIDRSVSADGNGRSAAGTFYYMNNTGDAARNGRACGSVNGCSAPTLYNMAASSLESLGDATLVVAGTLPPAKAVAAGVMTGSATLGIPGAAFSMVEGAFADNMTSWAALFDCTSGCQTPVSAWISQGASGSDGMVEEPCAYVGQFPSANFHYYYAQGMTIGESYLRSLEADPTHNLLYGDPLTRAFAYIPGVTVASPPIGTQSGLIELTPAATTDNPGAAIASYDLLVDGVRMGTANFGGTLSLNTAPLADGRHDVRVLAYDNTAVRSVGRWMGTLDTSNYGHWADLMVSVTNGTLAQSFAFSYRVGGAGTPTEIQLVQNGRVIAAGTGAVGTVSVFGQNLGAGISEVKLVALYADNTSAFSVPVSLDITPNGTPSGHKPVAYSYSKRVSSGNTVVVELPASFDSAPNTASYTLLNSPNHAAVLQSGFSSSGAYRIIQAAPGYTGSEQLLFQVTTPAGSSNVATITLEYGESG